MSQNFKKIQFQFDSQIIHWASKNILKLFRATGSDVIFYRSFKNLFFTQFQKGQRKKGFI